MTKPPPPLPPLPRVSWLEADARLRVAGARPFIGGIGDAREYDLAPSHVIRAYTLPRGSVIVECPDVTEPFACKVSIAGHFTYAVVCRERGDVEWPAWLRHARDTFPGVAVRVVREGYRDVLDAIAESQARARQRADEAMWLSKDPAILDEYGQARYYAALANRKVPAGV